MTKDQLIALEAAYEKLDVILIDYVERRRILPDLEALLAESIDGYYAFDDSKKSLIGFMRRYGITIPQSEFDQWRIVPAVDQRPGEINGLPESHGVLRATNGIMCYIDRGDDLPPYLGHVEFFIPDPSSAAVRISHNGKPKVVKGQDELDRYLAML